MIWKFIALKAIKKEHLNYQAQIFITLTSVPSGVFTVVVNVSFSDFYKLGTVIYKDEKEVEYVQPNELLELNLSPLTKPTEYFPVYKYKDFKIHVFPTSINSNISCTYIKKPKNF